MTGIQFVTDDKGRKVAVQIDLKKYGPMLEDFWDGLVSESAAVSRPACSPGCGKSLSDARKAKNRG
jgi:hypothetical protein